MIYIKIYLDKDENGEDMLVFDSVKHDDKKAFFTVAGEKEPFLFDDEPIPHFENKTKVVGIEQVAISPEAKELFIEMLNDKDLCKYNMHFVDFELYGLSIEEIAIVRAAFALAGNKNYDEMKAIDANLCELVEMAKTSAKTGKREVM